MRTGIKYKKQIICMAAIIIFAILFPYIVTCVKMKDVSVRVYKPKLSGKSIVLDGYTESDSSVNSKGEQDKGNVTLDLEEFLPCVLYSMLPYDYEEEALKVQLLIIRTYIMMKMGENKEIRTSELGLPYTTFSDLEKKWGSDYEKLYNNTNKLIYNTSMQVIKYDGNCIYPYYHEVGEGTSCEGEYEYLKPVESREDVSADNYLGISYFAKEEIISNLKKAYGVELQADELLSKIVLNKYETCNYVKTISIGEVVISGEDFMQLFSLASLSFTVEEFAEGIKMVSKGVGNGKGLSLYGAKKMAEQGSSYEDIIKHYYSGVEIVGIN